MMNDIKILELTPEKFNNAAVKNNYIENSTEQYIGFVDKSVTDKTEAGIILDDYEDVWNDGFDVIVFADCAPEDDRVASLASMPGMKIFGIVIRRTILKRTGRFNTALEGCQNREFLCRAAEYGHVFFITCRADTVMMPDSKALAKEAAYIVCRNLARFGREGILDTVFGSTVAGLPDAAATSEFNNMMDMMLSDSGICAGISANTQPFLVIIGGDTCYGVLKQFGYSLAAALADIGEAVYTSDEADASLLHEKTFKGIIGFQTQAFANHEFDWLKGRRYQFWFDDPAFFESMFANMRPGDMILCQDDNYAGYIRKIYGADAVWFPPAGNYSGPFEDEGRNLDIVFVGTYYKPEFTPDEFKSGARAYDTVEQNEVYKAVTDNPAMTVEDAVVSLYGSDRLHELMKTMFYVRKNIIDYYRQQAIEALLAAGFRINVYGDSWKNYKSDYSDNLIIHPEINVTEASQIYRKAGIGLNLMTWHKAGMTERVADIMLGGAVCISDTTTYLRDNFNDNEIVLFDIGKPQQLVQNVKEILENDALRHDIALAGYNKAVHFHTWHNRAISLVHLTEDCNGETES